MVSSAKSTLHSLGLKTQKAESKEGESPPRKEEAEPKSHNARISPTATWRHGRDNEASYNRFVAVQIYANTFSSNKVHSTKVIT